MPSLSDGGGERLESSLPVPALHTVVTDVDVVLLESDREVNEDAEVDGTSNISGSGVGVAKSRPAAQ